MKRRLYTIVAVTSLLLSVAVILMWVRSHRRIDAVFYKPRNISVFSVCGTIGVAWSSAAVRMEGMSDWTFLSVAPTPLEVLGTSSRWVDWQVQRGVNNSTEFSLSVPYWMVLSACCITAAAGLWLRGCGPSYQHPGLCPSCGYDLRATPHRCPECGHAPTPKPAEASA